jgi:hypothetical protein
LRPAAPLWAVTGRHFAPRPSPVIWVIFGLFLGYFPLSFVRLRGILRLSLVRFYQLLHRRSVHHVSRYVFRRHPLRQPCPWRVLSRPPLSPLLYRLGCRRLVHRTSHRPPLCPRLVCPRRPLVGRPWLLCFCSRPGGSPCLIRLAFVALATCRPLWRLRSLLASPPAARPSPLPAVVVSAPSCAPPSPALLFSRLGWFQPSPLAPALPRAHLFLFSGSRGRRRPPWPSFPSPPAPLACRPPLPGPPALRPAHGRNSRLASAWASLRSFTCPPASPRPPGLAARGLPFPLVCSLARFSGSPRSFLYFSLVYLGGYDHVCPRFFAQ